MYVFDSYISRRMKENILCAFKNRKNSRKEILLINRCTKNADLVFRNSAV